jgi:pyroglutamyl-peptidase
MRILLTAFEPYDRWESNSSWDALVSWLSTHGGSKQIVTRKYPVDLVRLQSKLEQDLAQGIDGVLHLGQAPGISRLHLESIALNVAGVTTFPGQDYGPIVVRAPVAYRTTLPIGSWVADLQNAGIPSSVSYHAGTYLCNAAMFLSHHWFASRGEAAHVGFVHLPLTPAQVLQSGDAMASLSVEKSAQAIGLLVEKFLRFLSEAAEKNPAPSHLA